MVACCPLFCQALAQHHLDRCCSILQAFEGILEVLGTAGDSRLGGNDFDALLADWLMQQAGVKDRQVRERRLFSCERALFPCRQLG